MILGYHAHVSAKTSIYISCIYYHSLLVRHKHLFSHVRTMCFVQLFISVRCSFCVPCLSLFSSWTQWLPLVIFGLLGIERCLNRAPLVSRITNAKSVGYRFDWLPILSSDACQWAQDDRFCALSQSSAFFLHFFQLKYEVVHQSQEFCFFTGHHFVVPMMSIAVQMFCTSRFMWKLCWPNNSFETNTEYTRSWIFFWVIVCQLL